MVDWSSKRSRRAAKAPGRRRTTLGLPAGGALRDPAPVRAVDPTGKPISQLQIQAHAYWRRADRLVRGSSRGRCGELMRPGRARRRRSEQPEGAGAGPPSPPPASWPTQQLAEFLALISSFNDEATATRRGIEHVTEVLDAEAAALVRGGGVIATVGFAEGEVPTESLVAVADGGWGTLAVPGTGECQATAVPLEDERPLHLVVARAQRQAVHQRGARPAARNGPGADARAAQPEAVGQRARAALGLRAPSRRERPPARGAARAAGAAGATRTATAGDRRPAARP